MSKVTVFTLINPDVVVVTESSTITDNGDHYRVVPTSGSGTYLLSEYSTDKVDIDLVIDKIRVEDMFECDSESVGFIYSNEGESVELSASELDQSELDQSGYRFEGVSI